MTNTINFKPFTFALLFEAGSVRDEEIARVIKLNLGEIGINVIPQGIETKELNKRIRNHNYEAVLYQVAFSESIGSFYEYFHSENISRHTNFLNIRNGEIDRLINRSRRIQDPELLEPIFHRLQNLIVENSPAIFLFFVDKSYIAVDNRFQNNRMQNSITRFRAFEEWFVPKQLHKYE